MKSEAMARYKGQRLLASCAALGLIFAAPAICHAAPQRHQFSTEETSLGAALDAYARTTGRQLLYRSEIVLGKRAPALKGRYDPDEALRRLLAGSGIAARKTGPNTFVLTANRQRDARAEPRKIARPAAPRAVRTNVRVRQAPPAVEESGPEIVVTGSHLRQRSEGTSQVITLGREEISRGGFGTVAEAVASLPQSFGGTGNEDTSLTSADQTGLNYSLASSANLRGLGSDATLTLVNGRRVAGSGGKGDFTDLSLIPLAAVERVEILTDGASAIYGSDAVGGVVNIILRRSLQGAESRLRIGTSTQGGAEDFQASQLVGLNWSGGHALLGYEFHRRGNLAAEQRRFTRSADLTTLGGDDRRLYFSAPGNVLGFAPTTGALVPVYAIPANQDGRSLQPSDFVLGTNLQNQLAQTDLLPRQRRHNGYATIEQELGPRLRLFAEGRYGNRRFSYSTIGSLGVFLVTGANPYFVSPDGAPFGIVAYSFLEELGATKNSGTVEAWSGTTGATFDASGDWRVEAYATHARERANARTDNFVNASYVSEALGSAPDDPLTTFSTSTNGFLNLYGSGSSNDPAILEFISQGFSEEHLRSSITSFNAKADGPLFDLPGGTVRAALGGAVRREAFTRTGEALYSGNSPSPLNPADADRSVKAAFAELLVPLFGSRNARPGFQRLELTGAVRHEHYGDFGSTTNPKAVVLWEPVRGFSLAGSYGSSFRAPALREVNDPLGVSPAQLPDAAGGQTAVIFLTGGNPDLQPEKANSMSFTARWAPPTLTGTSLQATYFRTRFSGRIEQPALEDAVRVLTDPIFAPFVQFVDPAGNPQDRELLVDLIGRPGSEVPDFFPPEFFRAIVDARHVNAARVVVSGIDVLANHRFALAGGEAHASLNASYLIDYKRQITPAAPLLERVATLGNPTDLRARASASWSKRGFGITSALNYVNGLTDHLSVPIRSIGSWTTFDAQLRYEPPETSFARGLSVALSVQNLFDNDPPFANRRSGHGYDATNADPIGRFISFQLIKRW